MRFQFALRSLGSEHGADARVASWRTRGAQRRAAAADGVTGSAIEMNRKLIAAAAGVLLLGAGAAGLAQAQDRDAARAWWRRGRRRCRPRGSAGSPAASRSPRGAEPAQGRTQPAARRAARRRASRSVNGRSRSSVTRARSAERASAASAIRSSRSSVVNAISSNVRSASSVSRSKPPSANSANSSRQTERRAAARCGPQGKEARSPERAGPSAGQSHPGQRRAAQGRA